MRGIRINLKEFELSVMIRSLEDDLERDHDYIRKYALKKILNEVKTKLNRAKERLQNGK